MLLGKIERDGTRRVMYTYIIYILFYPQNKEQTKGDS